MTNEDFIAAEAEGVARRGNPKKKKEKSDWVVQVRCEVMKYIYCEKCTKDEAWENPFDHAVDEVENYQIDWVSVSIEENI